MQYFRLEMSKGQIHNPFEILINKQSLDARKILYIENVKNNRGIKKIHLCDSTIIIWKTRRNPVLELNVAGNPVFIKAHRNYIINRLHICGRDSKWQYLQICFYVGFLGLKGFMTQRIDVGRTFIPEIRKYTTAMFLEVKDEEGEIYFINPIDIIFIEISKEIKRVFLNKSFPVVKNIINWKTRLSAGEIIRKTRIDGFFVVHRKYIINATFQFSPDIHFDFLHLVSSKLNTDHFNKKIPVGLKYKTAVREIFNK